MTFFVSYCRYKQAHRVYHRGWQWVTHPIHYFLFDNQIEFDLWKCDEKLAKIRSHIMEQSCVIPRPINILPVGRVNGCKIVGRLLLDGAASALQLAPPRFRLSKGSKGGTAWVKRSRIKSRIFHQRAQRGCPSETIRFYGTTKCHATQQEILVCISANSQRVRKSLLPPT